jgi:hypothetical protein
MERQVVPAGVSLTAVACGTARSYQPSRPHAGRVAIIWKRFSRDMAVGEQARPLNALVPGNAHFNELAAMLFEKLPGLRACWRKPRAPSTSRIATRHFEFERSMIRQRIRAPASSRKRSLATVVRQRGGKLARPWPARRELAKHVGIKKVAGEVGLRVGTVHRPKRETGGCMPQIDAEAAATATRWPARQTTTSRLGVNGQD